MAERSDSNSRFRLFNAETANSRFRRCHAVDSRQSQPSGVHASFVAHGLFIVLVALREDTKECFIDRDISFLVQKSGLISLRLFLAHFERGARTRARLCCIHEFLMNY